MKFERNAKTRRPALYAVVALFIAACAIGAIQLAGSGMTSAHSGLGGKLAGPADVAPAAAPLR